MNTSSFVTVNENSKIEIPDLNEFKSANDLASKSDIIDEFNTSVLPKINSNTTNISTLFNKTNSNEIEIENLKNSNTTPLFLSDLNNKYVIVDGTAHGNSFTPITRSVSFPTFTIPYDGLYYIDIHAVPYSNVDNIRFYIQYNNVQYSLPLKYTTSEMSFKNALYLHKGSTIHFTPNDGNMKYVLQTLIYGWRIN